jgi:hypothetical protein
MAGVASGVVFGAGTAWLQELSRPPFGEAGEHATRAGASRDDHRLRDGATVTGILAQWAPVTSVVPYVPHIALMAGVLVLGRRGLETVDHRHARHVRLSLPDVRSARFRRVVAPMAPWVFAATAIAFALLPSVIGAQHATDGIALTATITALCALAGVLIQPVARRLDDGAGTNRAAAAGLLVLVAGLALAALTTASGEPWLLVPSAVVLGSAYGMCLVARLVEIQRLADRGTRAGVTSAYYALTYLGFGAPYVLAAAANVARYSVLLMAAAGLALLTAAGVTRSSKQLAS